MTTLRHAGLIEVLKHGTEAEIVQVIGKVDPVRSAAAKKAWLTRKRRAGNHAAAMSAMDRGSAQAERERNGNVHVMLKPGEKKPRKRAASSAPKVSLPSKVMNRPDSPAKVQQLRRIGVRALAQADWLSGKSKDHMGYKLEPKYQDPEKAKQLYAKARAAQEEMVRVAQAIGDPRARGL